MHKSFVLSINEELDLISKLGFTQLNSYRKAEVLVGDSESIDLIHLYFSVEGRRMIHDIDEQGKVQEFIQTLNEVRSETPTLKIVEAFLVAYDRHKSI